MRRFFPKTLRTQLMVMILTTFVVVQGISLWLFADERSLAVRAALGLESAGRAANVVRLIEAAPKRLRPEILRAANSPLVRFRLAPQPSVDHLSHGTGGNIEARIRAYLEDRNPREIRAEIHQIKARKPAKIKSPSMERMHRQMMVLELTTVEMRLSIALHDRKWLNITTRFHRPPIQWPWLSSLSYALATLIVMALVWFGLGRLTDPLRKLASAAKSLGRGETVEILPEHGPEELRGLTTAFNEMQNRLTRFVSERTRLLAALGHDLRSPLTALRVRSEMVDDTETRERLIATIEEMQEMVESTLSFARGMVTAEETQTVDLEHFLSELVRDIASVNGPVDLDTQPGLHIRIKPVSMRRALRNVIENALRYASDVHISARQQGEVALITITDHGPGIPEADLERVFDPFVRVEKSRNLETGGTGLGLSIARTVVHAHGGDIKLANKPEGGLQVTITLPEVGQPQNDDFQ